MAVAVVEATPKKSGPSMVIQIAVLLVMSVAAAGIGWVSGGILRSDLPPADPAAAEAAATTGDDASGGHGAASGGHGESAGGHGEGEEAAAPANPLVLPLPAITTNLAAPSDIWVRVELDIVLGEPSTDPNLVERVHQDLLAFIRTVKMHQIEGASGFQHLKTDMEERAATRSDGLVKMVLIKTLLFE